MPDDRQPDQQFERAMTTMFACRSVIKYNSQLNDDQKQELILDIDASLQLLRSLVLGTSPLVCPEAPRSLQASHTPQTSSLQQEQKDDGREKLQALYRIYHTYLGIKQDKSISSFVSRFQDTMQALNIIRLDLEQSHTMPTVETQSLERVSSFIADLYYIFVEFIGALSETLEANNVHIETEELSAMQQSLGGKDISSAQRRDLAPLYKACETQRRIEGKYGSLHQRVKDALAFLAFLEETLSGTLSQREGFITQLANVSSLLSDLCMLLTDYSRSASDLLDYK